MSAWSYYEMLAGHIMQQGQADSSWEPIIDDLVAILRACHQFDHHKYDANWLADEICDILAKSWIGDLLPDFGEQGAGYQTEEEIRALRAPVHTGEGDPDRELRRPAAVDEALIELDD